VRVRLILPLHTREQTSNASQIAPLTGQGVDMRVTPDLAPPPGTPPYMHAKTLVVDGRSAYLGSIDLETTEATRSRELGVTFRNPSLLRQLNARFQSDWSTSQIPG
jgi:cardiolipin synthase